MTLLDSDLASAQETAASAAARRNYRSNLSALAERQPWLRGSLEPGVPSMSWIYGRDGFLTARDAQGHWWGGCSLPRRAGTALLTKLDLRGVVGCFLAPTHAGQIAAALEKLEARQAMLVLQPDVRELAVSLGCFDFSAEISRNRLWFAAGPDWASMISALFAQRPGLPTPSQFIRTPATSDELVDQLIPIAEKGFNQVNEARGTLLQNIFSSTTTGARAEQVIIAPSHFRLWDDAGEALVDALAGENVVCLDPDDPAQASALGLALAARDAKVIVTANRSRADLPAVLAPAVRVLSWVTQPQIPAYDAAHPQDGLLLADQTWLPAAQGAGWPKHRVKVADWPSVMAPPPIGSAIALIADTSSLETPVAALELSSHHVLWELIRADLADPFALGNDVNAFINRRMAKLGISDEGFDRAMFITKLIVPAFHQGLAKVLVDAGVSLKIYGEGWNELSWAGDVWQGPIKTRGDFLQAVRDAAALVYAWPARFRHPIDSVGRPVLSPGSRRAEFLRNARAISHAKTPTAAAQPTLSRTLIDAFLV